MIRMMQMIKCITLFTDSRMALSVNVTIAMPPEMVSDIDDEADAHGMSRAEYVRHLIRQADDSPFDRPSGGLGTDEESKKGAA
jgi:hypothetical protein